MHHYLHNSKIHNIFAETFRDMKGRIIHGQFVWHRDKNYLMQILYLLPTIKVTKFSGDITYEKGSWTIDVIWLKLYITFGYIIKKSNDK